MMWKWFRRQKKKKEQQEELNSTQHEEKFMQAAHADEQLGSTEMNTNEQTNTKQDEQTKPDNIEHFMKSAHADEQLGSTELDVNEQKSTKQDEQTKPDNIEHFMKSAHADEQLNVPQLHAMNEREKSAQPQQTDMQTNSKQDSQMNLRQDKQQSSSNNKQNKETPVSKSSNIFNGANENQVAQDYSRPQSQTVHNLQELIAKLMTSSDFIHYHTSEDPNQPYWISYYRPSLDGEKLQKYLMPTLLTHTASTLEELKERIPMSGIIITSDVKKIEEMVLKGHAIVQLHEKAAECLLANIAIDNYRAPTVPLNESTVVGPQEGFVEDIDTNLNLVRKRLPVLELKTKEVTIGTFSKTKVVIMYLENLADKENVTFLEEALRKIEYDIINDSSFLPELMGEKSIFPSLINTERTDRVTNALVEGKLAIFVDGSPSVLLTPVSFFDFFISPEDYNVSWLYATFSRILRVIAVLFSICATPLYVAILSYHYELIPSDLLETLILSRAQVPFPPVLEALFLELAIDLLREAGARLPMKVGQTLGIVGGIVIGQASVEAGLTSNILLIFVALSALASFITPIYKMGNTVRLLRFPFLLFAEFGGLLGISIGFIFLFTHLFRLSSLRKPYALFYPMRKPSIKDSWIRFPLSLIDTRVVQARPQHEQKHTEAMTPKHASDFDD
ncbi:spore germination protein [Bacillus manliponensis]|uniref:spore germination protein n=1 Tax=Bacillus manliponensis TaxID=574376 RepID=UPI003518357B